MSPRPEGIRIVAICGSVRPNNNTSKALSLVLDELRLSDNVYVELVDPADLELGFPGAQAKKADVEWLQATMDAATGVVIATPEYHGSYSSVIKCVIENLGFPSTLAGKPVALLGVASGAIGAIKSLEHLRSVCAHVGALVLPSLTSIPHVDKAFDSEGRCLDPVVEKRVRGVATQLIDYIEGHLCPAITLEAMQREKA